MTLVALTPAEIPPLREAMLDIQVAVARYYAETSRSGDTGIPLRNFLTAAQRVNDLLTNQASDAATFKGLFKQPAQLGTAVVEGVKYARNVHEHVLSIVRPSDDKVMVGGPNIGYRNYEKWAPVPAAEHNRLRASTRALKASYDATLCGKPVMPTMLDLLNFYWSVHPDIVHRDDGGEWTGFPLMDQPGMPDRLHPEEPVALADAEAWLKARVPNGARVVCGQISFEGNRFLCGFTFTGRQAFSPFAETISQVVSDVAQGAVYLEGDAWENIDIVELPGAQGPVFASRTDLDSWAAPMTEIEPEVDWRLRDGTDEASNSWLPVLRPELKSWPSAAYALRRARRLNACVPPRY